MTTNANEKTYEFTITMTQAEVDEAKKVLGPIMRHCAEYGRMQCGETDYSFDEPELDAMVAVFHTLGERLPMRTYEFMKWAEARDEIDYADHYVVDSFISKADEVLYLAGDSGIEAIEKEIASYRLRKKTYQEVEESGHPVWLKCEEARKHLFERKCEDFEAAHNAFRSAMDELDAVIVARMKQAA